MCLIAHVEHANKAGCTGVQLLACIGNRATLRQFQEYNTTMA